jgi:hypothetical protein
MTLEHIDISYNMRHLIKETKRFLGVCGQLYPTIYLINKAKAIEISLTSDILILNTEYMISDEGLIQKDDFRFSFPKMDDCYVTSLMFRVSNKKEENETLKLFKSLTKTYNPDAIAYLRNCWYGEYPDPDKMKDEDVLRDPDAVRILWYCYYKRGDPQATMCVMPFINRGEIKKDNFNKTKNYDITIANSGWFLKDPMFKEYVKYPY